VPGAQHPEPGLGLSLDRLLHHRSARIHSAKRLVALLAPPRRGNHQPRHLLLQQRTSHRAAPLLPPAGPTAFLKHASRARFDDSARQILTWNPRPGTDDEAHAYIEVDPFSGALIYVRLFGELAKAGLDAQDPASYTEVMKNRAYCSGRYGQGMVWTEFGYFQRPDFAEMPSVLAGAWKPASTSLAHGMDNGDEWQCTRGVGGKAKTVSSASASARLSFESTFLLVSGSIARATEELRATVPAESQRLRFVSWDPDSGVLVAVNAASEAVRCFLLRIDSPSNPHGRFKFLTADLSTGAAAGLETDGAVAVPVSGSPTALLPAFVNPCDARSYAAAEASDKGVCIVRENEDANGAEGGDDDDAAQDPVEQGTFSYGIQVNHMVRAGAPPLLLLLRGTFFMLAVFLTPFLLF
jgi:hypothetical protein